MSISIGIGDLALFLADEDDPEEIEEYLETYRQLSRLLAAHGYPGYEEPRTLPPHAQRSTLQSFPAGYLTCCGGPTSTTSTACNCQSSLRDRPPPVTRSCEPSMASRGSRPAWCTTATRKACTSQSTFPHR